MRSILIILSGELPFCVTFIQRRPPTADRHKRMIARWSRYCKLALMRLWYHAGTWLLSTCSDFVPAGCADIRDHTAWHRAVPARSERYTRINAVTALPSNGGSAASHLRDHMAPTLYAQLLSTGALSVPESAVKPDRSANITEPSQKAPRTRPGWGSVSCSRTSVEGI